MVLQLLWKSLLAFLLFEFRAAYLLLLLAGMSLVYPVDEVYEEDPEDEARGREEE